MNGAQMIIFEFESLYDQRNKDLPIQQMIDILLSLSAEADIEIWSYRKDCVKSEILDWIDEHVGINRSFFKLRIRSKEDDCTPEQFNEKLLHESIRKGNKIDFVFASYKKSIEMWRRSGVFVLNCNQL